MSNKKRNLGNFIEEVYLNYKIHLSLVVAVVVTILYHFNIINNIKANVSNMIDLTAALLVIITLILTLLLYLNDKEEYKKKIQDKKEGSKHIYFFIFKIAISNILCTSILIIIGVLEAQVYVIKILFAFFGTYCFSYMMFGSVYMLWFTIFIVVGIDKSRERES